MSGFRLDGSGWSRAAEGRVPGPNNLSITYNATTREVTRHPDGAVIGNDIFDVLSEQLAEDPAAIWVGYLGYACRPDLRARPAMDTPDAIWIRTDGSTRTTDGSAGGERGVGWPLREVIPRSGQGTSPSGGATPAAAPPTYAEAFDQVQRRLRAGDSYEVNLTRRLELAATDADPDDVYDRLCAMNPAPYAAHLWHDGTHVLSASPELFATITDGRVRTKPIKGTTPRGSDPESDEEQRVRLATDPRYRAENLMITDLMRNDLSQVCRPGSVEVTSLMAVESYPAVHQLVSTIEGELRPGVGVIDAIRALFPAGSMTGAPKQRTMEIIDAVEETPRGVYSGALGWISGEACELSVVIRTLIRDPQGRWHAGTGGGITVHSDVESEWAESEWKLDRLLAALA